VFAIYMPFGLYILQQYSFLAANASQVLLIQRYSLVWFTYAHDIRY